MDIIISNTKVYKKTIQNSKLDKILNNYLVIFATLKLEL